MTDPITVRPAVHTARVPEWLQLLDALGARITTAGEEWVADLAAGRVLVREVAAEDPRAGTTGLGVEVPDVAAFLAAHGAAIRATGAVVEAGTESATIRAADGLVLAVEPVLVARTPTGGTAVMPLWYSPDVARAGRVLTALGLVPRISAEAGTWLDLLAPGQGGHHAVHEAPAACAELSFEHEDVTALAEAVEAAGVAVDVIDESYGRTARLASPERPDDVDARVWVNEAQRDLYGYRRMAQETP